MTDVHVPPELEQDPARFEGPDSGRDPERTPMHWDASPNCGFTTGSPWLPMGDDLATINVTAQMSDDRSLLQLHRRLIALRRNEPTLVVGDWASLAAAGNLLAYERRLGDRRLIVFLNLGDRSASADIPSTTRWQVLLSTALDRSDRIDGSLVLRPNEGVILEALEI